MKTIHTLVAPSGRKAQFVINGQEVTVIPVGFTTFAVSDTITVPEARVQWQALLDAGWKLEK